MHARIVHTGPIFLCGKIGFFILRDFFGGGFFSEDDK